MHVAPLSSADVEDDDRVRLVVLSPGEPYVPKSEDSSALSAARDILEHRGSSPRHNRNMVAFLAADQRRLDDLRQGAAEALAWRSVAAEAEELGLGAQQATQARAKADESDQTLGRRLAEAYTWALVPVQPEPTGPVVLEPLRVEGTDDLAARTARRLGDKGHLYSTYAPSLLRRLVLEGPLSSLWERGHVSVDELWDAFARYPYLPRLRDREVLWRSVETGPVGFAWQTEGFALAEGLRPSRRPLRGVGDRPGRRRLGERAHPARTAGAGGGPGRCRAAGSCSCNRCHGRSGGWLLGRRGGRRCGQTFTFFAACTGHAAALPRERRAEIRTSQPGVRQGGPGGSAAPH